MSDSRYENDPAYRQDVMDKLTRSPNVNFQEKKMPGHYGKTGTKKKKPMSKGLSKLPKAVQKKILKKK